MKTNIKICTPVGGQTLNEFLRNLKNIQKISNLIELRVDYIKNLKLEDLQKIRKMTFRKAIFTCRSKQEGGHYQGNEKQRKQLLETAFDLKFDYVDVELAAIQHIRRRNKKTKLIISHHDFKKTPSLAELHSLINKMHRYKPAVMKIATMVKTQEDISKLMKLLLEKKKGQEMIVIGMGQAGKITRVLAPLLGSYLTYASINKQTSAPGQIEFKQLKSIYQNLNF